MFAPAKWLALTLFIALLTPAGAAPTPVPGGANAVSALSGRVGETVFNGVLRIKIIAVREATAADNAALAAHHLDLFIPPGKKVMFMQSQLRNGTHDDFIGLLQYTLADKDDISVTFPSSETEHADLHILQGAAERQSSAVLVDKEFVPTKIIVGCSSCGDHMGFRTVRFTVSP